MNKKDQFVQSALNLLDHNSKQDVIENLYLKSLSDTYSRISKEVGFENEIRDRFIKDLYFDSPYLKKWIQKGILKLDWEGQVFKNKETCGRTDIDFFISGIGSFVVECKRLENASSKYIDEGLCRFINKGYSKNESYAGMMGFVVSGDIKKICLSLKEKCQQESYYESNFVRSKAEKNDKYFVTSHNREGTNVINIYHLFFEFSQSIRSPDNL